MKSYQFDEYGQPLKLFETETPAPQDEEVLVRIDACGVCHSDIHLWEGYFDMGGGKKLDLAQGRPLPFSLGHEIVGEVVAVGDKAGGTKVGDKGVVYPWIGCGDCPVCAAGQEHVCNRPRALGVNAQGGYSDHVLIPNGRYLYGYGDVPASLACTYACSGLTAYSALMKTKSRATGRNLLIIGAGGVGMAGLALAQAVLDTEIIVADIDEAKLEAAKQAGAAHVINTKDADAVKQVMKLTGGGAAAAIDFVGSGPSAGFGVGAIGKGGKLVIVGLFGGALPMSLPMFPLKAMAIEGSYVGSPQEMQELMALVRDGKVKPIPVEARALEQAQQTIDDLREGRIVGRVVLEPAF